MKSPVYILIIISLLLISCKKRKSISYAMIPPNTAKQMIRHYKDSNVPHNQVDILKFIRFRNTDLQELFYEPGTITFWTAANLTTHKPTVIVVYDEDPHSPDPAPVYYSMEALGITICPPPNTPPCDTEVQ